jgi:addiction module RelE/StbE family toxin
MWSILEESTVKKQLKKAPKEVLRKYEIWKNIAEIDGPLGIRNMPGFKDHTLKGDWKGTRSSYLNKQWRVIYCVHADILKILVLEVNPHDYRKKS